MTIPPLQITDTGITAPPTNEVIDGVWEMFKKAFGKDMNTAMNTPQGQLVTSLAAIITDERNKMIDLLNQFDPRYAQGIWQDGLGYIYFMTRKHATHSSVEIVLTGLAGTTIAAGTLFNDVNGNTWQTTQKTIIGNDGSATAHALCTRSGIVEAAPDTITTIPKAISGLDRITNPYAAIAGVNEESRIDFEKRRYASVAINSKNTNASTYGAVADLADVKDVFVIDNPTDETIRVGATNYPVIRNSILVSVMGGDDETIARTILTKAGSGCSFNGNTECVIADTENFPIRPPTYKVKFLRPALVPVFFQVTVADRDLLSYQDSEAVKEAIIKAFSSGTAKATIGQPVIASKFICPVAAAIPHLSIVSLKISKEQENWLDMLNIGVDEFPTTTTYQIKIV
ncbi:MAG: hypothetical protein [Bacteriophage sp.]|nr:MAG: hypothetical protein [Bacteriophage sp.]